MDAQNHPESRQVSWMGETWISGSRGHCRGMTKNWIASSLALLAMTADSSSIPTHHIFCTKKTTLLSGFKLFLRR